MVNFAREVFINKKNISKMSLLEIYNNYGANKLLSNEIKRRVITNIDEVRDFYKNHSTDAYIGNYRKYVDGLCAFLKLSPLQILDWECFVDINYDMAKIYLSNDYSWLNNELITKKVNSRFLYETLLENGNLYKYPNLLEILPDYYLSKILLSKNILYTNIPNFTALTAKCLDSSDIISLINRFSLEFGKYSTIIFDLLKINKLNHQEIYNLIINMQYLPIDDYTILLINVASDMVKYIDQNNLLFLILEPYRNKPDNLIKLWNSKFYTNLGNKQQFLSFMLSTLSANQIFDFAIENDSFYEQIKNIYDISLFAEYYSHNIEKCLKRISSSKLVNDYLIKNNYYSNSSDIISLFKEHSSIINFFVKSSFFTHFIKSEGNISSLLQIIEKYPEIIDMIDFNIIKNEKSSVLMKNFDENPIVERIFINNAKFISYILSSENNILNFMPLINKYNIKNDTINLFNKNFNHIQTVRPELSWGNSSLRPELLHPDFINVLGIDYIDAILQYNSNVSNIVVDLYKQGELDKLKIWLDYLKTNISDNHRMIHFYILAYENMKALSSELIINNVVLDDYHKQILEEIIDNNNIYQVESLEQLNHYFEVRARKLIDAPPLNRDELFLNTSSLENGVPWNIKFSLTDIVDITLDYIKYKFVDTGIITLDEYEYICKVKKVDINNNNSINQLIFEYKDKQVPTARIIFNKIRNARLNELNSNLLDLDEMRKIASYSDLNSPVYIESREDVEYIYLNGYDYKCIVCGISSSNSEKDSATYSHTLNYDFEQYRVFSEKIKDSHVTSDIRLSDLKIGQILKSNPESWDLIEAISTISTGVSSSRYNNDGYGWGKNSNVKVVGLSPYDAMVSHQLRDLKPDRTSDLYRFNSILYGTHRGELWFDRLDENNQRIHPEFIMCDSVASPDNIKAARTFNIPVVVRNSKYYGENYQQKLDLNARKQFLETFDVSTINDILFNSRATVEEKTNFLIESLYYGYTSGKLNYEMYISKLIDLKWKLYESSEALSKYIIKIDAILSELTNESILERKNSL